jgi:hypothetical protein
VRHPLVVRVLHLAIATGVAVQLFTSEFMKAPRPGRTASAWQSGNFLVHDLTGLAVLAAVTAMAAALATMRRRGGLRHVMPWVQAAGRAAIVRELAALATRPLAGAGRLFTVARTIQGTGLALLAVLGGTGWAMHGPLGRGERLEGAMALLKEVHEAAGSLLWVWLALHVAMALPALLAGRRAVLDIFRFGRGAVPPPRA